MGELSARAHAQFDELVERRSVIWKETIPQVVYSDPFHFQFRVAPWLAVKPNLPKDDPGRKEDQKVFQDEDPSYFLQKVGETHSLILNKFCFTRPQYILHTNAFQPQSDKLNRDDLQAAWSTLQNLRGAHIVIYNCGADAGSSLGHKHLQILPRPPRTEHILFPDKLGVPIGPTQYADIPFVHFVSPLPPSPSDQDLVDVYNELCGLNQQAAGSFTAHNMIMIEDWMLIIPRSRSRFGLMSANAAAMVVMVWVTKTQEYEAWLKNDPMKILVEVSIAK